ncbi:hypothetical protein E2C01_080504 [Portunus trituberculatus]|uniref:Uncharacterized protein n=1 Tax=Portunus trituberculatus TaxID=210409 RepID=A0A5B7IWA9_PORTR|nr:hypothetical protein [Portunus trituberculatus]
MDMEEGSGWTGQGDVRKEREGVMKGRNKGRDGKLDGDAEGRKEQTRRRHEKDDERGRIERGE